MASKEAALFSSSVEIVGNFIQAFVFHLYCVNVVLGVLQSRFSPVLSIRQVNSAGSFRQYACNTYLGKTAMKAGSVDWF